MRVGQTNSYTYPNSNIKIRKNQKSKSKNIQNKNGQFSPKEKYGGYTYADVVLRPMADAVNKAVK